MKDSFELIQHNFPEADAITILPVSDLHLKSILCNEREWAKFCSWLSKQNNTYIILNGDMINNNTRSSVGSPFDDTMRPRDQKKALTEYLEPIKHLILCATIGNHEARSEKDADDDPMYDVMCKLDLEDVYRQDGAADMVAFTAQSVYNPSTQVSTVQIVADLPTGVAGAVIRRSTTGYPTNETDGDAF